MTIPSRFQPPVTRPAAIIFDMDGVLVDSEPVHLEAVRCLLADHGVDYPLQHEENFYGCTDREVFRILKARYGLAASEGDLARAWIDRVVALLPGRLGPMTGVPDVLRTLRQKGIRLALASSSAPAIIATTLDQLGLKASFELIVSGHDVACGKPAPDIFLEAARRLGLAPADCLVIEDSFNGLCAASAAGMPCVVVPCGSTAGQDFSGATIRLRTLEELPRWLGEVQL
ncbi:MAG TPA: HAD family phosphatase [Vicinamibacterales bacterium]|jgi:HAD superfamily hydrolase (TIGR01509 family)